MRTLRAAFVEAVQAEDFTRFKFMDETSTNLTYCRRYARAGGGQRAHQAAPLHGGPNVTLVAALTPSGLQAAMTGSGAVNGDVFAAYLDQVLGPTLVPGDVVVLDNLPAHKVAGLAELVEARGARLIFTPLLARFQSHLTGIQQVQNLAAHGPGPHPRRLGDRHPDHYGLDNRTRREKLV